jgi:hypothetical protein
MRVKEKSQARMTKVKKKSFYFHRRMNNFSYNHRSLEIHLIIIFNASHHFVFQGTPYPSKDKPHRHGDPNNHVWDTQSLLEKVK